MRARLNRVSVAGESADRRHPTTHTPQADAVLNIVRDTMAAEHLKSAIVRVTIDGKVVAYEALGESMAGVPASTEMHFRNGAVAISYVATLLLRLVDEKKVALEDKLSKYLPDIPHADRVTLHQLAQMTSGYVDYVIGNDAFGAELYENPFRQWEPEELLSFADVQATAVRTRNQLELRAHQLRPAGHGAGEGHRRSDAEVVVRQGS